MATHQTSTCIDLDNPESCHFCDEANERVRPFFIPWKNGEGWWACKDCSAKATANVEDILAKRKIMGIKSFPEWFQEWGCFRVRRSDGSLSDMTLVDFPCDFCKNVCDGGKDGGRVQLSNGRIFIDMYAEDDSTGEYKYKQVMLQNLYENNPGLLEGKSFAFTFPSYIEEKERTEWNKAAVAAIEAGKKKYAATIDPEPSEMTDDETIPDDDSDEEDEEMESQEDESDQRVSTPEPCIIETSELEVPNDSLPPSSEPDSTPEYKAPKQSENSTTTTVETETAAVENILRKPSSKRRESQGPIRFTFF